jgi:hypothetical protein
MSMGAQWDTLAAALEDHLDGPEPASLITIYEELIDAFAGAKAATAEHPESEWSTGLLPAFVIPTLSLVSCKTLCRHFGKGRHGDCTSWFLWGILPSTCIVSHFEWRSIEEGEIGKKWFRHLRDRTPTTNGHKLARDWKVINRHFKNSGLRWEAVKRNLVQAYGFAEDDQGTDKLAMTFWFWSGGRLTGSRRHPDLEELEGTNFDLMNDDPISIDQGIPSITVTLPLMIFDETLAALSRSTSNGDTETRDQGEAAAQGTDEVQIMPHGAEKGGLTTKRESGTVSREGNDFSPLHPSPLRPTAATPDEEALLPERGPSRARNINKDPLPAPSPLRPGLVDVDALHANTSSTMSDPPGGLDSIEEDWDSELEPPIAISSTFVPVGRVFVRVRPARNRNEEPYILTTPEDGVSEVWTDTPQSLPADTPETDGRQRSSRASPLNEPQPEIGPDDGPPPCIHAGIAARYMSELNAQIRSSVNIELAIDHLTRNLMDVCNNAATNLQLNRAQLQEAQQEIWRHHQQSQPYH